MLFLRKECREIQSFAKIFSGALLFLWKPTPPKNQEVREAFRSWCF